MFLYYMGCWGGFLFGKGRKTGLPKNTKIFLRQEFATRRPAGRSPRRRRRP